MSDIMHTRFGANLCHTTGCLTNIKESQTYCQKCTIKNLTAEVDELNSRPTEEAYLAACAARTKWQGKAEQAEAEAKRLQEACYAWQALVEKSEAESARLKADNDTARDAYYAMEEEISRLKTTLFRELREHECAEKTETENARLRYLIQRSTVKALGQAAYDNSPCPAHGLELLDTLLDEMKNNYAIVREENAELKEQLTAAEASAIEWAARCGKLQAELEQAVAREAAMQKENEELREVLIKSRRVIDEVHDCEYHHNPEVGKCDDCELLADIMQALKEAGR